MECGQTKVMKTVGNKEKRATNGQTKTFVLKRKVIYGVFVFSWCKITGILTFLGTVKTKIYTRIYSFETRLLPALNVTLDTNKARRHCSKTWNTEVQDIKNGAKMDICICFFAVLFKK